MRSLPTLALLVATAVPALAAPAWAQESTGTVVWVRGSLRGAISPSSTWTPISGDTAVKAGDTLKTGEDSAAEVVLPSGARVTLGANTIVRLVDLEGLAPRVMTGRVHLYASPQGETHLAAGTFHLTGTDAEAVVERNNGNWRVAVLAGAFHVVDAAREPMDVDAGKLVEFANGGAQVATLGRSQLDDLQQGFQQGGNEPPQRPTGSNPPVASGGNGNRLVATTLSALLPGAGQLYAGELPRGLLYLGLNSALVGTMFYGRFYGQTTLFTGAAAGLGALNLIAPIDAYLTTPQAPAR
ncbi:MAG: hypothetical protein JWM80_3248 [Cyanobacteria bacterium RYN_339]|nr:hypothetical protein [Cyanobacteria bacterium RYN_339]